jgi:glycosyltransferase involved in cell wall biosynthesis
VNGEIALSIVLPVHDEVESLPVLWKELLDVLPALPAPVEVLFVDDGSTDGSGGVITRLAEEDPRIRVLRFEANAGLSEALPGGARAGRGHHGQ